LYPRGDLFKKLKSQLRLYISKNKIEQGRSLSDSKEQQLIVNEIEEKRREWIDA
jgi:hypothetical protein